jgi:hypothetical protein
MPEKRNTYEILIESPKEETSWGETSYRWEDNIKIDFKETGHNGVEWIHLTQSTVQWGDVNTVKNIRYP